MGSCGLEVKAVKNCMFVDVSDVKYESLRDGFGTLDVNDPLFDEDYPEVVRRTDRGGDGFRVTAKGGFGRCNFPR